MKPETLKQYRLLLGLSVSDAADTFGVARRTWQAYEQGTRNVPERIQNALAHEITAAKPHILAMLSAGVNQ